LIELSAYRIRQHEGFTLVEMLVALAVSSIVVAGAIAGYTHFATQYKAINQRISIDRDVLRVIDLMQADISLAGFAAYATDNPPVIKAEVFQNVNGATAASDFKIVYDAYKDDGTLYRALIHYYIEPYTSSLTGEVRQVLKRDWRECTTPVTSCLVGSSTSLYTADDDKGEPILDKVTTFQVLGLNAKTGAADSTFFEVFQALQVEMTVQAPSVIEGKDTVITKDYKFITRANNVSIVP
jgi:prepilin-type N-terminal cleavage/methylation domain-containing protein|tara:strand:+ start:10881 stop:11597 length:717 start_codon:yes stop_codon:yes gene_type:complete